MRHLIDPMDLSVEDIDRLLDRADDIAKNPEKYQEVCKHKKLATLFFEPSTRTRCSFTIGCVDEGAHPEYLGKDDYSVRTQRICRRYSKSSWKNV